MACLAVCEGAILDCCFGLAPSELIVLPENRVLTSPGSIANIMDHIPELNIPSFGMCCSPTNPEFAAATAAAMGVPTPVPCIPIIEEPWLPVAPTVMVGDAPILGNESMVMCVWAGVITIIEPGQFTISC